MGFAKHFDSMYRGSMFGAGLNVFAVWGYAISHARISDSTVELHPTFLSKTLGGTESEILSAIEFLERPDSSSRSKEEEGRRIVRMEGFLFKVVNFHKYRFQNSDPDRQVYMREYMREYRSKPANCKQNVNTCLQNANTLLSASVSSENNNIGGNPPETDDRWQVPDNLKTQAFADAWDLWQQHRREKKQKLTPTAAKQQLKKLSEMGATRAVGAILHSIANGWTGIFEEKKNGTGGEKLSRFGGVPEL